MSDSLAPADLSAAPLRPSRSSASARRAATPALPVLFAAGFGLLLLTQAAIMLGVHNHPPVEDDAFYYLLVARNLAATGTSTFDGLSLTNGYHPLWAGLLAGWIKLFGESMLLVKALEALLLAWGLALLLRLPRRPTVASAALATLATLYAVRFTANMGMETSLLFPAFVLLYGALTSGTERHRGVLVGLAGALCAGARIDVVLFVAPLVLAAPHLTRRDRWQAFAVMGAFGALHAGLNLWHFDTALPISGQVKSLGGLQVNAPLLEQLARDATLGAIARGNAVTVLLAYLAVAAALLSAGRVLFDRAERRLLGALLVGFALYGAKLLFFSSWVIWPWYAFPLLFLLPPLLTAINRALSGSLGLAQGRLAPTLALLAYLGAGAYELSRALLRDPAHGSGHFFRTARGAADLFRDVLAGRPVAMGDRAGSFAYFYSGPVVQLEGLVGDKAYLDTAKARDGDVAALLCRRGVAFVLDYEPGLGPYESRTLPLFRPLLTQSAGATLTVHAADEVGRFGVPHGGEGEDDTVLYAWRLRC